MCAIVVYFIGWFISASVIRCRICALGHTVNYPWEIPFSYINIVGEILVITFSTFCNLTNRFYFLCNTHLKKERLQSCMRPANASSWGAGERTFRIWQHPYILRTMCLLLVMLSARVFHEHVPEIRATDWERQMLFAPSRQSPQDNQGYREDRPRKFTPLEPREGLSKPTGTHREFRQRYV